MLNPAIADLEETGEMPALAETNVDLDLDDLTAACVPRCMTSVPWCANTTTQPGDRNWRSL